VRRAGRMVVAALPEPARRWVRLRRRDAATRRVSLDELDAVLDEAAGRFAVSEDDARAFLLGVRVVPPPWPPDPFTSAYRRWVWDLYAAVSAKGAYSLEHESSPFDLDEALRRPFPYATGSATVVADDLLARGRIVRALGLAAPARIVEFGPGWGNLTADLSAMGHDVTAVEVDRGFCRLLACRAPAARVVTSDMLSFASAFAAVPTDEPFDAAVFYESFHHCADHLQMLELLHDLVAPGGVVVFGGEPVDVLAYPWGPRLDGLSLWSTRRYGWLELGFDERYFADVAHRTGWRLERHDADGSPPTFVATSLRGPDPARR
jgi:SAM-dependent methyltransferase